MKQLSYFIILLAFIGCSKSKFNMNLIPVKSGDMWGYVDKEGKYIINPQFEEAHLFSEGLAVVKSSEGKYGYIGENGKYVINPIYKAAGIFSEGLACVVMENGKPQFIDKNGNLKFSVDAEECKKFYQGLAPIKIKDKWGYIDITGTLKINPEYDIAAQFSEGLAAVAKKIGTTKELQLGFINLKGELIIGFQFKILNDTTDDYPVNCTEFSEGMACVSSDGKKFGYINKEGKYEINSQFDVASKFRNGIAKVNLGDKYGYINTEGKYNINPQFKDAGSFSKNGLAVVQNADGKWGYVNKEGQYVINPQFDDGYFFIENNIAFVKSANKWGIINEGGKYAVNPQFDNVSIGDIYQYSYVYSDFIDVPNWVKRFLKKTDEETIRNISSSTTFKDIMELHPSFKEKDVDGLYEIKIHDRDFENSGIAEIDYTLSEQAYGGEPVYKTEQNKLGRNKEVRVIDHYETYNKTAKIAAVEYITGLTITGIGKSKLIADELKKELIQNSKLTVSKNSEETNNEKEGIYILKSNKMLVSIIYASWWNEENKYFLPELFFFVFYDNLKGTTFDEQELKYREAFKNSKREKRI